MGGNEDVVDEIRQSFEEGGNWPYKIDDHEFEQNPFENPWPDNKLFSGHDKELKRLQVNIQRGANTFILGPLGTGKTILTKTMRDILEDVDGYEPIFIQVEKGRFSKAMAKKILTGMGKDFTSSSSQAELYEDIKEEMQKTYEEDDIRYVLFFDEVINGSEGTLRRILDLQRDMDNWEPVLIFNGTTHMLEQVRSDIAPLYDRIMDEIHLDALDVEGAKDMVNKRLRYYCKQSEWNEGVGCDHDEGKLTPFVSEIIEEVHQDITPYPRHLRKTFNEIMEYAAEEDLDEIGNELVGRVMEKSFRDKLKDLSDEAIDILDFLSERGESNVNEISKHVNVTSYEVQELLTRRLEKQGFVRATSSDYGVSYKITETAKKELSNLREA